MVTSFHKCGVPGCEGLATFGFKTKPEAPSGAGYSWACFAHRDRAEALFQRVRAPAATAVDVAPPAPKQGSLF